MGRRNEGRGKEIWRERKGRGGKWKGKMREKRRKAKGNDEGGLREKEREGRGNGR